ncbi:MAG TPA: hypothetical protein VHW90_02805 [Stellaceae bacterium]|jgi:hypothetical protein|nr:hypothetical protein [Stellaceae bacterium]
MFHFVFGLPGAFSEWCESVTVEIARRGLGVNDVIRADTLEQIALRVMRTGATSAVVSSRKPGGRLRAALTERACDIVVALDDPRTVLLDAVLGQRVALADAVQTLASSCAALTEYAARSDVLVLHGNRDWAQPGTTAMAIAEYLGLEVDDYEVAEIIVEPTASAALRRRHDAAAWWESLQIAERDMVTGALAAYLDDPALDRNVPIIWTSELFFLGDEPNKRLLAPVDITGRVRPLLQGPHIMLPPGTWTLSLSTRLSSDASEHAFSVEVWTDRAIATGTMQARQEGNATIELDFTVDAMAERPVAIRISTTRAAFDGAIIAAEATLIEKEPAVDGVMAPSLVSGAEQPAA